MRSRRPARMAAVIVMAAAALCCRPAPLFPKTPEVQRPADRCTHSMWEYEKSNIDAVILAHARTCQTLSFGEIHDKALAGMPAPVQDSDYVATLLPRLKRLGYDYLALEVNKNAPAGTHSHDIVSFCRLYENGRHPSSDRFPHAKPGWIDLARQALDTGYKIRFIDADPGGGFAPTPRDEAMFAGMKREIFDADHDARVIVYIGAFHVGERETETGIFLGQGKKKPLGLFLDQYTNGRNFSIYMGNTHDTPVGCDLFISHFIWDAHPEHGHPESVHP